MRPKTGHPFIHLWCPECPALFDAAFQSQKTWFLLMRSFQSRETLQLQPSLLKGQRENLLRLAGEMLHKTGGPVITQNADGGKME